MGGGGGSSFAVLAFPVPPSLRLLRMIGYEERSPKAWYFKKIEMWFSRQITFAFTRLSLFDFHPFSRCCYKYLMVMRSSHKIPLVLHQLL